jgi:hypothetical protein
MLPRTGCRVAMKTTLLTTSQPRHCALMNRLSQLGDVYAVIECAALSAGTILKMGAVTQRRDLQIRYTRGKDFADDLASRYLEHVLSADDMYACLQPGYPALYLRPWIG